MSTNIIERSLVGESLEVRESAEGRRVCGIAAPFNKRFDTGDYVEEFARGAFAKSIADRGDKIPLLEGHRQDAMPLGRAIHLEERTDGLYAEFLISRTGRGEEALQLARDSVMHSFSVGFVPVRDTRHKTADGRPLVIRDEVKLHHVGLISEVPAYDDARVLAVRQEYDPDDAQIAPRLSVWRGRLYGLDGGVLTRGALRAHDTEVRRGTWDGGANVRRADSPSDEAYYSRIFAWLDPDADPTVKSSYGFPHHEVSGDGTPGAAILDALAAGVAALNGARGGTDIDDAGRRGIWRHLAHHYAELDMEAPPLR
jgi:hypothetical protein